MANWNIQKTTIMETEDMRELMNDAKVMQEDLNTLTEELEWTGLDIKGIKMLMWGSLRNRGPQGLGNIPNYWVGIQMVEVINQEIKLHQDPFGPVVHARHIIYVCQ